ncbi:MAG: crotonase/enoyl-CoA hydratase family protein [Gammaproteobacteria bacterium]
MNKFNSLETSVKNKILTICFNRPEKMNTFSGELLKEIFDALDIAETDDAIRAVIFTGSGKAFCAGADLSSGEDTFDMTDKKNSSEVKRDTGGILTLRLFNFKKPLIAAINGAAVGVGVTMTLPMDVRICSDKAKFGFVFAKRGIVPEACSSWFLPKIVGISNALQWCLSGRIFQPKEALEKGLVSEVTNEDELLKRAEEIAADFVNATSSISVTLIRQMLWKMLGADHPMEAHKIDSRGVYYLGKSGEASEGVLSFLEKREPNFPGKVSKDLPEFYPWWDEKDFK